MFFLKRFPVCFNIVVLLFLVTPYLVVAVQSCMEWIPIKKKRSSCIRLTRIFKRNKIVVDTSYKHKFVFRSWHYDRDVKVVVPDHFLIFSIHEEIYVDWCNIDINNTWCDINSWIIGKFKHLILGDNWESVTESKDAKSACKKF